MNSSSQDEPDYTMMSRRWSGEKLINSEIAIEIARQVHLNKYGSVDLNANEPLSIKEDGNNWVVLGSKKIQDIRPDHPLDGPFTMKISRFDGQILSYYFVIGQK